MFRITQPEKSISAKDILAVENENDLSEFSFTSRPLNIPCHHSLEDFKAHLKKGNIGIAQTKGRRKVLDNQTLAGTLPDDAKNFNKNEWEQILEASFREISVLINTNNYDYNLNAYITGCIAYADKLISFNLKNGTNYITEIGINTTKIDSLNEKGPLNFKFIQLPCETKNKMFVTVSSNSLTERITTGSINQTIASHLTKRADEIAAILVTASYLHGTENNVSVIILPLDPKDTEVKCAMIFSGYGVDEVREEHSLEKQIVNNNFKLSGLFQQKLINHVNSLLNTKEKLKVLTQLLFDKRTLELLQQNVRGIVSLGFFSTGFGGKRVHTDAGYYIVPDHFAKLINTLSKAETMDTISAVRNQINRDLGPKIIAIECVINIKLTNLNDIDKLESFQDKLYAAIHLFLDGKIELKNFVAFVQNFGLLNPVSYQIHSSNS